MAHKHLIKITEDDLHKIIKESINQIIQTYLIYERRNIQSKKLYDILQKHGGVAKYPGQHHNYVACLDFNNLQDNDVIGVFDYNDIRDCGGLTKKFMSKYKINLDVADTIEKVELGDGTYLVAILRGGRFDRVNAPNREKQVGDFEERCKKQKMRDINKIYRRGDYHWENEKARDLFHNPWFRNNKDGWTKDEKSKAMDDARNFKK